MVFLLPGTQVPDPLQSPPVQTIFAVFGVKVQVAVALSHFPGNILHSPGGMVHWTFAHGSK